MKNQIVSLFIKREHMIFLSKILSEQNHMLIEIDLKNQKIENRILKTERWPQQDLDYFQNTFLQIANLAFSYFKMHFPINSALQIRDHIKFTQCLKQINYGGVTLEEVFKQQRIRLLNSLSIRLTDEVFQSKILNTTLDIAYIGLLQGKYFNSRNPEYKTPYGILNLKPTEMKVNIRPNRDLSISQYEDVPQLLVLNTTLIQPILNCETLMSTFDYKFQKLMQRNQSVLQTIKNYCQKIKNFSEILESSHPLKQMYLCQIQSIKQEEVQKITKLSIKQKCQNKIKQLKIETDNPMSCNQTNESERNKSILVQTSIKLSKNLSVVEDSEYQQMRDRKHRIKKRSKNFNSEILHQQTSTHKKNSKPQEFGTIIEDQSNHHDEQKYKKSININIDENTRSLTQYVVDDSFRMNKIYQYKSCNNSKSIADKCQKIDDKQMESKDQFQNTTLEEPSEELIYKFRRSQYAQSNNNKIEDELNSRNFESMKQLSTSSKRPNVSLERLTLRPIDYVSVCTGNQKMKLLDQYVSPIKPKRFQTQEKEDNAIKEILKIKKQSNQNVRNALLLLTCTRSEQLLTSLIASGTIKHQQYQSFLKPIKINSTAKHLTPK